MTKLGHLINGIRIDREERTQDIYNPSVGEVAGQVGLASKTTVEEAVAAAEAAIGLAILVVFYRNLGSIEVNKINKLKG